MVTLIVGLLVFRPMIYDYFNNTPQDMSEDYPSKDDNTDNGNDNSGDNNDNVGDNNKNDNTNEDNSSNDTGGNDNIIPPTTDYEDNEGNVGDSFDDENKDDTNNQKTIYATDLVINYTDKIYIHVGQSVKLLEGFVSVEPAEMRSLLTYSIASRYNSDPSNVEFDGTNLTVNKAGQYNLIYKVPNTDSKDLQAKIVLIAVDEENDTISQRETSMQVGSSKLSDYFDIKYPGDIRYECSENIKISNNSIIASQSGIASIDIFIAQNNIEIKYSFEILVKDKPNYYIEISSSIAGEISDPSLETLGLSAGLGMYAFGYSVFDKNNQKVSQDISVVIEDETIVSLVMITDGLVLLDCKKVGVVEIIVTFNLDTSVYKIIHLEIN